MNLPVERNVVVFAGAGASAEDEAPAGFDLFLGELEYSRGVLEGRMAESAGS